ncbi:MAG TPA: hypothetical protein PLY69_00455 [Bacteroidales bacterium]|nr:hypothetical protein [Bacteroidales bacterium]
MLVSFSYAQLKPEVKLTVDEQNLYNKSYNYFFEEDYVAANQGFSQLVSLYPKEEVFSYYYGACLVKLAAEPKSGVKYLEYSANKGINTANFYIGLANHFMYDFEKALSFYDIYQKNASQKELVNFELEQYINMANSGSQLVKYAYELKLVSLKRVSKKNFHYSYNLNDFGGNIIVKTDQFRTKIDRKIMETDLMYISDEHNVLFFSSYGDSKRNSLDIYMSRKVNGNWTAAQKLPETINTKYDEAYPFLSEDGKTLYFASKGHNSMGGYDIFKTNWDNENNQWSEPKNLDFPINSPFDDIMYAVDKFGETAFFTSTRESKTNECGVFRILVESNPQKREMRNIDDIYLSANPSVSELAISELSNRQKTRTELSDTIIKKDVQTIEVKNLESDIDLAIQKMFAELDEISGEVSEYKKYASTANKLSQESLSDIKKINSEVSKLKTANAKANEAKIQDLQNQINDLGDRAIQLNEIAKYFYDFSVRTEGLLNYYLAEVKVLDKTSRNEKSLERTVNLTQAEINKIDRSFPLDKYIDELNKIINSENDKLAKYDKLNKPLFSELEQLNTKITTKIEVAKSETEFELREKYIYDIKTYENQKIDLIDKIKENQIQIEFAKFDIAENNKKIAETNSLLKELEENLFLDPNLNLSKANNDIEVLKSHKSQTNLKELSDVQKSITSDLSLYSPIIDYDAILYGEDIASDEVTIDKEEYINKFSNYISSETKIFGESLITNDSLKNIIANLELDFDKTESPEEKQNIINNINNTQIKINENKNVLRENSKNISQANNQKNISNLEVLKAKDEESKFKNEIAEIQNLISVSTEIEDDISDFQILSANKESLDLWLLKLIKNDIDQNVEIKISELENQIKGEVPQIQSIIAEMKQKLSSNQNRINQSKPILAEFEKAKSLFAVSETLNKTQEKNQLISQANGIIEENLKNTIDYLNTSLQDFYSDYLLYSANIKKYDLADNRTQSYSLKAEYHKQIADSLQILAEENSSESISLLGEAYKNIEIANLNLNYIFEFLENGAKYVPNKNFGNRLETLNFINEITTIKTKELLPEEIEVIVELEPKNIEELILKSEQTSNEIQALTAKFASSNDEEKDEILKDIEKLNQDIKLQLKTINEEIMQVQQRTINEQLAEIVSNNPKAEISDLKEKIKHYTDDCNTYYETYDYYLLSEVVIRGANILNQQNELLKNKKVIILPQSRIDNLIANSAKFENFVDNESQILAENKKLIAEQSETKEQENVIQPEITEPQPEIAETIPETVESQAEIAETKTEQADESSQTQEIKPSDTERDLVVVGENIEVEKQTYNLDEFAQYLSSNTGDSEFLSKNTEINNTQNQIDKNQTKILDLNNKIEQTNSQKQKSKLISEKSILESEQTKILIEQSQNKLSFIKEVNETYAKTNPELINNSEYQKLIETYKNDRNSVISYSNFYSNAELIEIYEKANATENLILTEIAKNLKSQGFVDLTKPETREIASNELKPENEISYQNNYEDEKTLNSLQDRLEKLEISIKNNENQIQEYNKLISESSKNSQIKKHKKSINKIEKQQIKLIKDYAETAKNYEILTYNTRTKYFDEHLKSEDEIINTVSDSLKTQSEQDFEELISVYYKLLSFDSKVENQTIFEEFEKAKKLSQLSFKNIELANEVLSFQDRNTEVLMPYYKQLVIEDLAENTETKTSVETHVPEKEVIADSQENVEEEVIQVREKLDEIAQELETYDFYYRIQFAAYNEMVGEENFPTLLPLFTERIANSRLIRFMTGTYFQLATAQQNLPRVRATGFEDAFIVAYFNGKRITIAEARRIEQELQVQKQEELLVSKDETTTETTNVEIETDETFVTVEKTAEPELVIAETRTTINTELAQTTDVFYCIQVGVYRERINPERLYNLAPLFYDEYRPGLVRHVFGKYYDLNTALQEQNRIRQLGITDAFVTAYANGKQIYLYEARNLLANENLENKQEITLSEEHVAQAQGQAQERPEMQREPREPEQQQEVDKIEYYIQLGAFRNEPNNIVRDMFLKLAGNKKLYKTTNNNLHIYRVGSFDKYNEALTQLNNIKNLGVTDAFVLAFNNGKRINLTTARQLE